MFDGNLWDATKARAMEAYGQEVGYSMSQVAMRAGHHPSVAARHYKRQGDGDDGGLARVVASVLAAPSGDAN